MDGLRSASFLALPGFVWVTRPLRGPSPTPSNPFRTLFFTHQARPFASPMAPPPSAPACTQALARSLLMATGWEEGPGAPEPEAGRRLRTRGPEAPSFYRRQKLGVVASSNGSLVRLHVLEWVDLGTSLAPTWRGRGLAGADRGGRDTPGDPWAIAPGDDPRRCRLGECLTGVPSTPVGLRLSGTPRGCARWRRIARALSPRTPQPPASVRCGSVLALARSIGAPATGEEARKTLAARSTGCSCRRGLFGLVLRLGLQHHDLPSPRPV